MFFETKNLCFSHYRQPLCLRDINFSLDKKDKVLLLASKDMGKTTFLSVLSGFERSYFGSIKYDGKELRNIKENELSVSYLPEDPVLLGGKTIKQNFDFLCGVLGKDCLTNEEAEQLCKNYNLNYEKKIKVKKLKVIDKKKLCFARAELKNANVIFVDDQFAGVGIENFDDIANIYNKLLNNNQTVIISVGDENYKKSKDLLKKLKFDKIFYLCDAKMRFFDSLENFEKEILTIDMFSYFDEKYETEKCLIEKQDKFYNIVCEEKFFSLDESFNKNMERLKLKLEDTEDSYIFSKEKLDFEKMTESEFNKILKEGKALIFSGLDGERVI